LKVPDFKQAVKTNVFIVNFNNQTFHVVGRERARPPGNLLTPPSGCVSSVKSHCCRPSQPSRRGCHSWELQD